MTNNYIEIDGYRKPVTDWIRNGLDHATSAATKTEHKLANALYDELSNQWMGRGLMNLGGGGGNGKSTVVVAGSIDLIAVARRALRLMKAHDP